MYAFAYIYAVLCSRDGTSYQNTKDQACPVLRTPHIRNYDAIVVIYLKGFRKCNGQIVNEVILVCKCLWKENSTFEF